MSKYVVSLDKLAPTSIPGGFETIRLCYGLRPDTVGTKNLSVNYVVVEPGWGNPHHTHMEEGWYIIRGTGFLRVGEERFPIKARDLLYVPADVPHQVVNNGTEPLEMLTITTPPIDFSKDAVVIEAFDPARHLG